MTMLCLKADYESARAIGPWLRDALEACRSAQLERVGELELAIHEVAINVVDHAFGAETTDRTYTVSLTHHADADEIRVELRDEGVPFVAAATPNLDEPQVGGYGLFIAEQLTSKLSYERDGATNVWTLIFADNDTATRESRDAQAQEANP